MLGSEHGALALSVGIEGVLAQAVVPQPLEGIDVLGHELAHHGLVGLAAEVAAGLQDVLYEALLAVLHAVLLLDDALGAGHAAVGVVQRAAGLAGDLQNDNLLRAVGGGLTCGGQARAAGRR